MRIVFIITGLSTGGAEMMLLKVLARLDRQRFAPHVISLTTRGELASRIAALGIPLDAVGLKPSLSGLSGFFRLVRLLKRLNPDVVHTWMYHADLLGGLAARLAGAKAVAWGIRNSNLDKDKTRRCTRWVVAACARLSSWLPVRIVSCSQQARAVHVALGYDAAKMTVIPNGFDLARFKPDAAARVSLRTELGLAADTPLVGLIGRFDPQKNHAGFFEAAGLLHCRLPDVHFVLAGQGVDAANPALAAAMAHAGVAAYTHLLGLRDDMPRVMAALDVLASSSYGEAFPNVLGEAMACGVPCVVTDVGDSAYIVGDTGRVVASGDMAGLALGLEELLAMPATEKALLGERARARVAEHFEIGKVVQQYADFYEDLLANVR
ncbi:MAG: glycosyltransferase [Pseudomonadota bacterium]